MPHVANKADEVQFKTQYTVVKEMLAPETRGIVAEARRGSRRLQTKLQ